MENMRFKVGDRVRIKSLDWYNENKNSVDNCDVVFANGFVFSKPMSNFCGKELIIERISHATNPPHYIMKDNMFAWTDEMIECKVEKEVGLVDNLSSRWVNEFTLPEGYIFKDEYGNMIVTSKIILEKKKKEYPKTFEECVHVLEGENRMSLEQMNTFRKLIDARNAYWKIAGEEMGLGKPWKPDWDAKDNHFYTIYTFNGKIECSATAHRNAVLIFPTEEMRDAFYENFKELIESVKELL